MKRKSNNMICIEKVVLVLEDSVVNEDLISEDSLDDELELILIFEDSEIY
jgi:hypothetical protein